MSLQKILVLAPVMAWHEQTHDILKMLAFLQISYEIDIIDPLQTLSALDNISYYQNWQTLLAPFFNEYKVFIGFSFGAVILQQCFHLLEQYQQKKSVILFSAPAFSDKTLQQRLGAVITLAKTLQFEAAYTQLMQQVLHPYSLEKIENICDNPRHACARLVEGLTRVLTTDSRAILASTSIVHQHFIGEDSYLVNRNHVMSSTRGELIIVPNAGMRVLSDNVEFCQKKMLEVLI